MKAQFVTFEIADKLKKMGFDEECLAIYGHELEFTQIYNKISHRYAQHPKIVLAPLWQQAMAWLMNSKDIFIEIAPDNYTETELVWYIYVYEKSNLLNTTSEVKCLFEYEGSDYKTYEKAREAAILKTLEILETF